MRRIAQDCARIAQTRTLSRRIIEPSGWTPCAISVKSCSDSAAGRSRYGEFLPGEVSEPRYSRISSGDSSSTYARPSRMSVSAYS